MNRTGIYHKILPTALLVLIAGTISVDAQIRYGEWLHRNASDTAFVRCWNDTGSTIAFPPGCFPMGHMYPDSLYCRFDLMPMDSLSLPFDSTFVQWRRIGIGSDSGMFDVMQHHGGSGGHMMGFRRRIRCDWRWDSTMFDQRHRRWHPTGITCWNGDEWVTIDDVTITDTTISFTTETVYAAMAVVGEPASASGVEEADKGDVVTVTVSHPHPFRRSVVLNLTLARPGLVHAEVYDLRGNRVFVLRDRYLAAGTHRIIVEDPALPDGVHFVRIRSEGHVATARIVLTR